MRMRHKDRTKYILETVQAKRGYLLAHHELFGYPDPDMLEKYDQIYEHLTLKLIFDTIFWNLV